MIQERLFALQDEKYREFHRSLIPGLPRENIIGIRIPAMRKLAKEFVKEPEAAVFLKQLPHTYYDENILHALLIAEIKDYDACMEAVEAFLPYIDNWAVCDGLSPKVFGKHKAELLEKIRLWIPSEHTYTCRFGIGMLMRWFLDEDFQPGYLELPAAVLLFQLADCQYQIHGLHEGGREVLEETERYHRQPYKRREPRRGHDSGLDESKPSDPLP